MGCGSGEEDLGFVTACRAHGDDRLLPSGIACRQLLGTLQAPLEDLCLEYHTLTGGEDTDGDAGDALKGSSMPIEVA
jgi:hypothetical protein